MEEDSTSPSPSRVKFILRALSSRNYRLFFSGQIVSLIGTWLTSIATAWLVYRLSHSAAMLGIVGFAGQIPAFVLAPFAGVLVDRWPLRRTLVFTQFFSMLQSFALAFFALRQTITVGDIIALQVVQGLINAFDIPARQAFVVQLVERREDLPNAIALNSTMFNSARLVGPAVAGVIIAAVGEGWCFFIDGVSYFGVLLALLAMHIKPHLATKEHAHVWAALKEGFVITFGFPPMRALIGLLALTSLAGMPYTTLMPVFAEKILHGNARTLGFLVGASGVGALVGAMYLASRKTVVGLGRVIFISAIVFGASLIAFGISRNFFVSLAVLFVTGLSMILQNASCNTLLQTLAEDEHRGRVMSFFTMAFMGTAPIGALIAGSLASHIGAPLTVIAGGATCALGGLLFALILPSLRPHIRPIYIKRGILPAVAAGIQSSDNIAGATE